MMLGTFTGVSLANYIGEAKADYVGARRTVNGTDRAADIAGYARSFEVALREAIKGAPGTYSPIVVVSEPGPASHQPSLPTAGDHQGTAMTVPNLSPIEQSGKAVGAGTWTAVAGSFWTVLVGLDVLPAAVNTPEVATAVLTIVGAVAAAVGAYRARDKRFTPGTPA